MRVKHIIKETRKRLKRKAKKLDPAIIKKIEEDIEELQKARASKNRKKLNAAKNRIYIDVKKHLPRKPLEVVWEYVSSIGAAVLIALAIRHFVVEPFKIPSGSMIPTLMVYDKILVNKFIYGPTIPIINHRFLWRGRPKRWDIIVFTTRGLDKASDFPKNFVKRVAGLPGDEIEIKDGDIYVNGRLEPKSEIMQERKIHYFNSSENQPAGYQTMEYHINILGLRLFPKKYTARSVPMGSYEHGFRNEKFKVPENKYFVLGDNSQKSYDSRGWGFVPYKNIKGKVICIWWPPKRINSAK